MQRRWYLLIAAVVAVAATAFVFLFVVSWPDANHDNADKVVREAGVPISVTPAIQP